jgi:hypothetical protein
MDRPFQPIASDHLPRVRSWLDQPHVREWWGNPLEQYDLICGDLDEPAMDQYILSIAASRPDICNATLCLPATPASALILTARAASICS